MNLLRYFKRTNVHLLTRINQVTYISDKVYSLEKPGEVYKQNTFYKNYKTKKLTIKTKYIKQPQLECKLQKQKILLQCCYIYSSLSRFWHSNWLFSMVEKKMITIDIFTNIHLCLFSHKQQIPIYLCILYCFTPQNSLEFKEHVYTYIFKFTIYL